MHRLRRLRTGLSGVRDFCAGRPAREVEAIYGTERKLREGWQIHARRIRQAPRQVVLSMFLFTPKDLRRDLDDLKKGDFDSRMKGIAEDHRWVSKLRDIGDSVAFQDAGRPFHLEVVNVTSSPSDNRKVALRVCEY